MSSSQSYRDYNGLKHFTASMATATPSRPAISARQPSKATADLRTPSSPHTPLLGRSISSQFNSPSTLPREEECIIYELGSRHLSAGFAGEGRPRCTYLFSPEDRRRVGDYRFVDPGYARKRRKVHRDEEWGRDHELYQSDLRSVDLGLVEDRLERASRAVHEGYLQLDNKPRKAVLAIPSLLPTPLVEVALKVLFQHYAQPPAVTLLTTPLLACVGAGLRNGLVVDFGWEECVVTAVGEHKEVYQRRTVRAGRLLTREMGKLVEEEIRNQSANGTEGENEVSFEYAEEVTQRMGWCRSREGSEGAVRTICAARSQVAASRRITCCEATEALPTAARALRAK